MILCKINFVLQFRQIERRCENLEKDSLIITRETMLGHLLLILRKLNNIEKKVTLKLENEQLSFLNNKEYHINIKKL